MERVLDVATCLALGGYGEAVARMTGMAHAFHTDVTLWNVHKAYRGPRGRTLLMHAASAGDVARARFLLERGAAINGSDPRGASALVIACVLGNLSIMRCLVEHGGVAVKMLRLPRMVA